MLSGHDYALGASSLTSSVGVQLRQIPLDNAWPAAPVDREQEQRVLDDWLPQRRDPLQRAQALIDVIDSQLALIDDEGDIALVNRAWRLTAAMQETSSQHLLAIVPRLGGPGLPRCRASGRRNRCRAGQPLAIVSLSLRSVQRRRASPLSSPRLAFRRGGAELRRRHARTLGKPSDFGSGTSTRRPLSLDLRVVTTEHRCRR